MAEVENLADWRGKDLVDSDGEKVGKLHDVYVDTQTDEPMFAAVKEGHISKHLTFVPLAGAVASPDGLKVVVTKQQVKHAPNIEQGAELSEDDEADLYRHYDIAYTPSSTASRRRLAKR